MHAPQVTHGSAPAQLSVEKSMQHGFVFELDGVKHTVQGASFESADWCHPAPPGVLIMW